MTTLARLVRVDIVTFVVSMQIVAGVGAVAHAQGGDKDTVLHSSKSDTPILGLWKSETHSVNSPEQVLVVTTLEVHGDGTATLTLLDVRKNKTSRYSLTWINGDGKIEFSFARLKTAAEMSHSKQTASATLSADKQELIFNVPGLPANHLKRQPLHNAATK